jgi:hypothetical protein
MADIGSFKQYDTWVMTEPPIELPVAHINGVDLRRTPLEQTVGEPARRTADVETDPSPRINRACVQRRIELLPTSADKRLVPSGNLDGSIDRDQPGRFVDEHAVALDLSRQNDPYGGITTLNEALSRQHLVTSMLLGSHSYRHARRKGEKKELRISRTTD